MFELEDYNADVLPDEKQKNKQKQKKTISNHLFCQYWPQWQLSADLPVAVTNIVPH